MDPGTAQLIGSLGSAAGNFAASLFGGGARDERIAARKANYGAIQGKIQAAQKFGIHPLYALGAPTSSPAGFVGGSESLGSSLGHMGADISRAVSAYMTPSDKAVQALALQKAGLENDYLRAQINYVTAQTGRVAGSPPGLPDEIPVVPGKIKIPGGYGTISTDDMNYAQRVQNWGGDVGENVFGTLKVIEDGMRSFSDWYFDPSYWNSFGASAMDTWNYLTSPADVPSRYRR